RTRGRRAGAQVLGSPGPPWHDESRSPTLPKVCRTLPWLKTGKYRKATRGNRPRRDPRSTAPSSPRAGRLPRRSPEGGPLPRPPARGQPGIWAPPGVTEGGAGPPPPPLPLPTVPGYEVLGELGRGGMGVVYQARQQGLGRTVALKMIRAADGASAAEVLRFRREAEAVARLQHPNIVQIHEVGEHQGRPYFSLEFVEDGGLDKDLARAPP